MGPASTPGAAIESVAAPLRTSTPGQSISFGVLALGLLSTAGGPKIQDFILSVMSWAEADVAMAAHSMAAAAILAGVSFNLVLPAPIVHPSSTEHDLVVVIAGEPWPAQGNVTNSNVTSRRVIHHAAARPSARCSDAHTADGP